MEECNVYCAFCGTTKTCSIFDGVTGVLTVCNTCRSVVDEYKVAVIDDFSKKEIDNMIGKLEAEICDLVEKASALLEKKIELKEILGNG